MTSQKFPFPTMPFSREIHNGCAINTSIILKGKPYADQKRTLTLQLKSEKDIALHITLPLGTHGKMVVTSQVNGNFSSAIEKSIFLPNDNTFQFHIRMNTHAAEIYNDNVHLTDFVHRVDPLAVKTFSVEGPVLVEVIRFDPPSGASLDPLPSYEDASKNSIPISSMSQLSLGPSSSQQPQTRGIPVLPLQPELSRNPIPTAPFPNSTVPYSTSSAPYVPPYPASSSSKSEEKKVPYPEKESNQLPPSLQPYNIPFQQAVPMSSQGTINPQANPGIIPNGASGMPPMSNIPSQGGVPIAGVAPMINPGIPGMPGTTIPGMPGTTVPGIPGTTVPGIPTASVNPVAQIQPMSYPYNPNPPVYNPYQQNPHTTIVHAQPVPGTVIQQPQLYQQYPQVYQYPMYGYGCPTVYYEEGYGHHHHHHHC